MGCFDRRAFSLRTGATPGVPKLFSWEEDLSQPARKSTITNQQIATPVSDTNPLDGYLNPQELAAKLRTSTRTLDRWYVARVGPPRISVAGATGKRSRTILYKLTDVTAWLDSLAVKPVGRARGRRAA